MSMLPNIQRTRQPQRYIDIDWGNPITRGLVAAIEGGRDTDPVNTCNTYYSAGATQPNKTVKGIGNTYDIPGDSRILATPHPEIGGGAYNAPWTLMCEFSSNDNSGDISLLTGFGIPNGGWNTGSGIPDSYGFRTLGVRFGVFWWWIPNLDWNTGIGWDTDGKRRVIAIVYDGSTISFVKEGIVVASGGYSPDTSTGARNLFIGGRHNAASKSATANIGFSRLWNRSLSLQEIVSLTNNPWQIFKSINRDVFTSILAVPNVSRITSAMKVARTKQPSKVRPNYNNIFTKPDYVLLPEICLADDGSTSKWATSIGTYSTTINAQGVSLKGSMAIDGGGPYTTGDWTIIYAAIADTTPGLFQVCISCEQIWTGINSGSIYMSNSSTDTYIGAVPSDGKYIVGIVKTAGSMKAWKDGFPSNTGVTGNTNAPWRAMQFSAGGYNWTGSIGILLIYKRALSDKEVATLTVNPWQVFAPTRQEVFSGIVSSIVITRPSSDEVITGWTSTASTLSAAVNEDPIDDASYITSPDSAGTIARLSLAPSLPPGSYVLNIRVKDNYSGGNVVVTFTDSTGTPNYGSTTISLTGSYLTYSVPITISGGTATSCNIYQTGY